MVYLVRTLVVFLSFIALASPGVAQDATPAGDAQQLIDLLENAEARDALIASLREVANEGEALVDPEARESVGRQIAGFTKSFFETAATSLAAAFTGIASLPGNVSGLEGEQLQVLWEALKALALVIAVTFTAYMILRAWSKTVFRRMGERAHDWGFTRTVAVALATILIDSLVVVAAWGLGYLSALYLYGEPGVMGVRQSLYLNAFLLVGLAKVAMRAILSPTTHELRFVAISDAAARRMSLWFGNIISIIGYGQLLVVPIVNQQASLMAGRGASTILAFVAIALTMMLVLRSRQDVTDWFLGSTPETRPSVVRFVSRNWYVPVLIYLAALAIIVAARPDGLIWPVLLNSSKVIAVVIAGFLISGGLTRFSARGLRMPGTITDRMPTLEPRLNALLARILGILRGVIAIGVFGFALDAIGVIDLGAIVRSDFGTWAAATLVSVSFILLFGIVLWLSLVSWVDYRLNPDFGSAPTARETTLLTLLRNAATIALFVIILMFVLAELGVDIAPLIASAGVLGLAIGFGAQKMVQDIITGIFIQFENAINVGDVVTLGGTTGSVEKLTIRSVTLRDVQGAVHVIPFSSVDMVTNYVKDFSFYVCDLGIAYRENVEDGKAAMFDAFEELRQTDHGPFIRGDLEWFGVQTLGDSAVVLRARIKCDPGKQWAIGRAFNEICKRVLDARGIEIPFPHQTIYFGVDKDGTAPALTMRKEGA